MRDVRAEFPILDQQVHGRPLVYLDNAATTQKPRAVLAAMEGYYRHDNANVHRGVHTLSQRASIAFEAAREAVRRFVNAREAREIVFLRGTTEAINLVATSFGGRVLGAGDEVLITELEHHANIVPWQMACERAGAKLRVVPIDDRGEVSLDDFRAALGPRTRAAAVAHVSNALGTVNPVAEMIALAHERGVPVLLDGAQATSHLAVDVQALDCDFYAFSGHKVYGPTGIGALYGKAEHLEAMPPWQGGGDMIRRVSFERIEYAPIPAKFEAGTPNIAGAIGLAAALDWVTDVGLERIAAHEALLLAACHERLAVIRGLRFIGTARRKAGVCSFVMEGVHPHDLGTIMDRHGVAIRAGHHCAMPVMAHYCVPATARASFAAYNDLSDIEALAGALQTAREVFS